MHNSSQWTFRAVRNVLTFSAALLVIGQFIFGSKDGFFGGLQAGQAEAALVEFLLNCENLFKCTVIGRATHIYCVEVSAPIIHVR